jgi:thiol-disulfide isomerase/thioredoxin
MANFLFAYQVGDMIDKEIVKELDIDNKIYVVSFFASWCHSCKKELPLLNSLNLKNVSIIGVDVDEDETLGKKFQQELGLKFKIINDPKGKIISKFNPVGIPAIYIIKNRKIKHILIGAQDNIDSKIIQYIGELK